ncbi:hypothetical protein A5724_29530 [Mycobacterium sp. ACS1612]|nr:hypothetical protein A5724_29530 [Mycobacterium sp. ACS1612]
MSARLDLVWSVLGRWLFGIRWRALARDSPLRRRVESGSDVVQICRKQARIVVERRRRRFVAEKARDGDD